MAANESVTTPPRSGANATGKGVGASSSGLAVDIGMLIGLLATTDAGALRLETAWFSDPLGNLRAIVEKPDRIFQVLRRLLKTHEDLDLTLPGLLRPGKYTVHPIELPDDDGSDGVLNLFLDERKEASAGGQSGGEGTGERSHHLGVGVFTQMFMDSFAISLSMWTPVLEWKQSGRPRFVLGTPDRPIFQFRVDFHRISADEKLVVVSVSGAFDVHKKAFSGGLSINYNGSPQIDIDSGMSLERIIDEFIGGSGELLKEKIGSTAITLATLLTSAGLISDTASGSKYALSADAKSLLKGERNIRDVLTWDKVRGAVGEIVEENLVKAPNSPIIRVKDDYGFRLSAQDMFMVLGSDPAEAPVLSVQIGKWLPSGRDAAAWRMKPDEPAGLEVMLLNYGEASGLGLASPPSVRLSAVGLDIGGAVNKPLISVGGFSLKGVELRLYWDSARKDFGIGGRLKGVGVSVGGDSPKGGGPAAEILGNAKGLSKSAPVVEFTVEAFHVRGKFGAQLYDKDDRPTDMIWLAAGQTCGPLTVEKLGVGVRTIAGGPAMAAVITGRVAMAGIGMRLIDAALAVPFKNPGALEASLGGMQISFERGAVSIRGGFLKISEKGYAGELSIQLPKCTITAMGIYESRPVEHGEVTTLFVYGTLSLTGGSGIKLGAITITGMALGVGINRRVVVPDIKGVAQFPLVKAVMGDGGGASAPEDGKSEGKKKGGKKEAAKTGDTEEQKEEKKGGKKGGASDLLTQMAEVLPFDHGQMFACVGLRFTIAEAIDAFALAIAQFGNDMEFTLLGLARFSKSAGSKRFCNVELAVKMTLRPQDGVFLLQAELTGNSWVMDEKCSLTGGFALGVWFSGKHKGDFVLTLGGYHPKFQRPAHYIDVPRLGLNWPVSDSLSIKGEFYCAVTPSHLMAGGRLEATYQSARIRAWFVAHVDFLMSWAPLTYSLDTGIAIRVQAELPLQSLDLALNVALRLWGPPFTGIAEVSALCVSFTIEFGGGPSVKAIDCWVDFGKTFLDKTAARWATKPLASPSPATEAPAICQTTLRSGLLVQPGDREPRKDGVWIVRGDELSFSVGTVVPATRLQVGTADAIDDWIQGGSLSGRDLVVAKPVKLIGNTRVRASANPLGLAPLDVADLSSTLTVTVVHERRGKNGESEYRAVSLEGWKIEEERGGVPAALWDVRKPEMKPEARMIADTITGIASLAPPSGRLINTVSAMLDLKPLDPHEVTAARGERFAPRRPPERTLGEREDARRKFSDDLAKLGFDFGAASASAAAAAGM